MTYGVPEDFRSHSGQGREARPALVPGIYEVGGDVLKISILPPNANNKRPAQFEAAPSNGSFLFVMKWVAH